MRELHIDSSIHSSWVEDPELWDTVILAGEPLPGISKPTGTGYLLRKQELVTAGSDGAAITLLGLDCAPFDIEVRVWSTDHLVDLSRAIERVSPRIRMRASRQKTGTRTVSEEYTDYYYTWNDSVAGLGGSMNMDPIGEEAMQAVTAGDTGSTFSADRTELKLRKTWKTGGVDDWNEAENVAIGTGQSMMAVRPAQTADTYATVQKGEVLTPVSVYHPSLALFGIRACTVESISLPQEREPGVWTCTFHCKSYQKPETRGITRADAALQIGQVSLRDGRTATAIADSNRPPSAGLTGGLF